MQIPNAMGPGARLPVRATTGAARNTIVLLGARGHRALRSTVASLAAREQVVTYGAAVSAL